MNSVHVPSKVIQVRLLLRVWPVT